MTTEPELAAPASRSSDDPFGAAIVAALTLDEKLALLNGSGMWRTAAISRLGIGAVTMTDGTHGVRVSRRQFAPDAPVDAALTEFLAMMDRGGDERAVFGASEPSTCYPAACSYGCSWNVDLARELGRHLAAECRALGVDLLLGPGVNLRRTPYAGRGYEYYSEDPILSGEMAGALIGGLQEDGVGAVLKHFACNESETDRTRLNSLVSPRALREVYLRAFERAIERGRPWAIMSAYNLLNGEQAAQSAWLLTQVLRDDWGFEGLVMSDWHGIKDRPASLRAGNDLDMPESRDRGRSLRAAFERGEIDMGEIDRSCARVIALVRRVAAGRAVLPARAGDDHHEFARRVAEESIVLLRNDDALLPLCPQTPMRLAVIGPGVEHPLIQGLGSSRIYPTRVDDLIGEIRAAGAAGNEITRFSGWSADADERSRRIGEAVAGAEAADIALLFVNVPEEDRGGEETDRPHLRLADGQDELVRQVVAAQPRTIVILFAPDAVMMPWIDGVPALLAPFFAGQGMAHALARILFGHVNPSGKLTTSFARCEADLPVLAHHPGNGRTLWYGEDIFTGYRSFDRRGATPLFPFGHGLSYTQFRFADLRVESPVLGAADMLRLRFTLANTGDRDGSEVCQLYAAWPESGGVDPERELKAFRKIFLRAGETREVEMRLPASDLRRWRELGSSHDSGWVFDRGALRIEIGSSSRWLPLTAEIPTRSTALPTPIDLFSPPKEVLRGERECALMKAFLVERLDLSEQAAEAFIPVLKSSFLGIGTTLQWFAGSRIGGEETQALLAGIDALAELPAAGQR